MYLSRFLLGLLFAMCGLLFPGEPRAQKTLLNVSYDPITRATTTFVERGISRSYFLGERGFSRGQGIGTGKV
jgi:hypothetical protein